MRGTPAKFPAARAGMYGEYGLALVYAHKTRGGAHLRAGCAMAVSTSAMKPPKMPQAAVVPTIGLRHDFEESSRTHNR